MSTPDLWAGNPDELATCQKAAIPDLIRHIMEHYHREGRVELANLETLAEQAALLEGETSPVLLEIRAEVECFVTELRAHFRAEERDVFPAILAQSHGETPWTGLDRMRLLEDEHVAAAGLLRRLRKLTEGFRIPGGAGDLQTRLYMTLDVLADSLTRHIYLENHILFPRALNDRRARMLGGV